MAKKYDSPRRSRGACAMFMHFCALFCLQLFLFLEIKLLAVVEDCFDQKTRVLMSISSFGFFVLVLSHIVMRAFLCWPALVAFFRSHRIASNLWANHSVAQFDRFYCQ